MKLKKLKSIKQLKNIYRLYKISFPKEEKKPFWFILAGILRKNFEISSIEDKGKFKGLAITLKYKNLVLLDYLVITSDSRSLGYGSKALSILKEHYQNYRFFLEIESSFEKKPKIMKKGRKEKNFTQKTVFRTSVQCKSFWNKNENFRK